MLLAILSHLKRIHLRIYLFSGLLVLGLWSQGTQTLQASQAKVEGAAFSLSPTFVGPVSSKENQFTFQEPPGTVLHSSIHVVNYGDATGTVNLYPVDSETAPSGGVSMPAQTAPRRDVGSWIVLAHQQLTLAAGQSQDVPFVLHIPNKVRSGQHGGGIVAEPVEAQTHIAQNSHKSTMIMQVRQRMAVGVLVVLPGPLVARLQLLEIAYGASTPYQNILLGLKNTGNMMLLSQGYLHIRDMKGKLLQNLPLQISTIMPQDTIYYPVYMRNKALPIGTYQAELMLQYTQRKRLYEQTTFDIAAPPVVHFLPPARLVSLVAQSVDTLSPWYYALPGGFLFLLIGSILFWRRRRAQAHQLSRR
jgi:hypothetical protein